MRVLYATDGSSPAREGERLIASLVDPTRTKIHVLSVAPEPVVPLGTPDVGTGWEQLDVPPVNPEVIAAEGADRLAAAGFTVSSAAARGNPALEILRELDAAKHEVVVLGASHTTWLGNVLLGSVSMHVLHHATCPVIVTHRAPSGSGRILIGVDGSEEAMHAARVAAELLDRTRCSFTVVSAVSDPWVSVALYPPGPPFGGWAEYNSVQEQRMEQAWHLVESACAELRTSGFSCEGAVLAGSAGPQLLKEADNVSADLIVVGSRGHGPVKRALLGSVGDQVVRHGPATLVGRPPRV